MLLALKASHVLTPGRSDAAQDEKSIPQCSESPRFCLLACSLYREYDKIQQQDCAELYPEIAEEWCLESAFPKPGNPACELVLEIGTKDPALLVCLDNSSVACCMPAPS